MAGPVNAGTARFTNRGWEISEGDLKRFGFKQAILVNDFEALAFAAEVLVDKDLSVIGPDVKGRERANHHHSGPRHRVWRFLPGALWTADPCRWPPRAATWDSRRATRRNSRPCRRCGSKRAGCRWNEFCRDPVWRICIRRWSDWRAANRARSAPRTSALRRCRASPGCRAALTMFCSVFGAVAGDLALAHGARGGVYIAGGITQKIQKFLDRQPVSQALRGQGPAVVLRPGDTHQADRERRRGHDRSRARRYEAIGIARRMKASQLRWPGAPHPALPACRPPGAAAPKRWSAAASAARRLWFTVGGGHRERGVLPAHRHSADSGSRLHRRRRARLLGGSEAAVAAHGGARWRRASPAVRIVHRHARFELTLRIVPASERDVLLIDVALSGRCGASPLRAARAASRRHRQRQSTRRSSAHSGRRVLAATQGPFSLALAAVDRRLSRTPSAERVQATSARATAGRISIATAR